MEQFHVTPVDEPKKTVSKKMIILLVVTIGLLVLAIAAAAFFAFQANLASSKLRQLEADKTKLTSDIAKLKADQVANAAGNQALLDAPKNANSLTQVLDDIYKHPVDLTSGDKETIMAVAKKYYKVETAPEGATVLLGYEMVKPDTPSSGQARALVYWPGKEGERPQFLDVIRPAGETTWRTDAAY